MFESKIFRRAALPLAVVAGLGSTAAVAGCSSSPDKTPLPLPSSSFAPAPTPADRSDDPMPKCLRINSEPVPDKPHTVLIGPVLENVEGVDGYAVKNVDYKFGDGQRLDDSPSERVKHTYPGPGMYEVGVDVNLDIARGAPPVKGNFISCVGSITIP